MLYSVRMAAIKGIFGRENEMHGSLFLQGLGYTSQGKSGMGGRAAEGTGLENRQGSLPRGFESHPIRRKPYQVTL